MAESDKLGDGTYSLLNRGVISEVHGFNLNLFNEIPALIQGKLILGDQADTDHADARSGRGKPSH